MAVSSCQQRCCLAASAFTCRLISVNCSVGVGPSDPTDIEGSYVRGAHGPRFLHVVVIGWRLARQGSGGTALSRA
jgi:L-lactate dehydrogenase complex protein LldG